ncbi:MAG: TatD family hydrolase [Bacteroidales bacterium]
MLLIDSHSHLFSEEFDEDRAAVIHRAGEAGIGYHIMPNIDSSTTGRMLEVSQRFPQCFPLMGLHPTSVKLNFEDELLHVEGMLQKHKFYGIGEIGIDLYWDKTYIEQQKMAFRHQLKLAKRYRLPVAIHSRNSLDEIFEIVDSEIDADLKGVFHCFTGTLDQYKHILEYKNFKVGIGGVVTYKNGGVNLLVPQMDLDSILLETDSPYLSPVPVRGKRNEGYNLLYVAKSVASLLELPLLDVAGKTAASAQKFFNLPIQ